jgi:hypothetical protein
MLRLTVSTLFERRQAALGQRREDFATDKKALDCETALVEKENKRSAEWDKKMEELQGLRESSAQLKKTGDGCGSKHYKPPRKLHRKVIGLVYEQCMQLWRMRPPALCQLKYSLCLDLQTQRCPNASLH